MNNERNPSHLRVILPTVVKKKGFHNIISYVIQGFFYPINSKFSEKFNLSVKHKVSPRLSTAAMMVTAVVATMILMTNYPETSAPLVTNAGRGV